MVQKKDKIWVSNEFKNELDRIKTELEIKFGRPLSKLEASRILAKFLKKNGNLLYKTKKIKDKFEFEFHL